VSGITGIALTICCQKLLQVLSLRSDTEMCLCLRGAAPTIVRSGTTMLV
jgi:hypothetical protein